MRAAVYRRYGPPEVVQIENVGKPVPKDNEILVRVCATTVCTADWRFRKADPFPIRLMNGFWRPSKTTILGMELAGTIESVGKSATRFAVGDAIFGLTGFDMGAHAEYVCLPENAVMARKPDNLGLDESAAILFGGVTALHFLKGRIQPGQKVLVYGASGSVGTCAVQLAKHSGAQVTGVCSTANLELVKSLGADEVVDYTRKDFAVAGRVYDMVFDAVGKSGFRRSMKCLKRGGCYIQAGFAPSWNVGAALSSLTGAAKMVSGVAKPTAEDAVFLRDLVEAGKFRPVIDRRYSLDQIVEAHRYAEAGHKRGNVLVVVSSK